MYRLIILLFLSINIFASGYSPLLTFGLGMAAITATENDAGLTQTDTTVTTSASSSAQAASTSIIALDVTYEFKHKGKYSYFTRGLVPLITSNGASIFMGSFGFNYYLSDVGSKFTIDYGNSNITIAPSLTYFIGAAGGIGYHVYNTESSQFSDTFFDLSVHGGINYKLKENWGLSGKLNVSRVTGVATTGISFSVLAGVFYYL